MIEQWKKQLAELSGNLTTNEAMPAHIAKKLLAEDDSLKGALSLENVTFPKLSGLLGDVEGLDILSGLQKINKKECLTLFRAVRFPTYKRIFEAAHNGYAISNFEQERILDLYQRKEYIDKRSKIKTDPNFWTQPQERVVNGLPLFCLANDALQIHRAFRGEKDKVMLIAIHLPHALFESGKIKLIANTAIDLDYTDDERDFEIKDFYKKDGVYEIDFEALRARGIDLHEMYTSDLPLDVEKAKALGISQEVFLLDIYKIKDTSKIDLLFRDTDILKKNKSFLHGFFGDQNIFGRRKAVYLPCNCMKVSIK